MGYSFAIGGIMRSVLIISPDPEEMRTLSLLFELHGWKTQTAVTPQGVPAQADFDLIMVDFLEGISRSDHEGCSKLLTRKKGKKLVIILPRGTTQKEIQALSKKASALVPRPFELLYLMHLCEDLFRESRKAARKKKSATRPSKPRAPKAARPKSKKRKPA